ncbi:MAG: molybdopterin-dependent oxidoreductase [Thermodesulfobacteriota bacterium]
MSQEKVHYRSCSICEAMCGLEITTRGDEIVAIRGDEQDPFSRGYICPKGTAVRELHHDPDRLRRPVRRTRGGWEEISWEEALSETVRRVNGIRREHGRRAVALYFGNPNAHYHGNILFAGFLVKALDTPNRFSPTSADQLPMMMVCYYLLGHQFLFPAPDIDRTDYFLIIGGNPAVSGGSFMTAPNIPRRLRAIRERGGRVVVIDPVRTRTAELADRHLFIRPGTDLLLMLSMVRTVFEENLVAPGHLAGILDGVETIRVLTAPYTPEQTARATGIEAGVVRALVREFCASPSAVCYGRMGTCVQEFGTLTNWMLFVFNLLTGRVDRPGGFMFPTPALDLVAITALMKEKGWFGRQRTKVRGLPDFGGELPVAAMAEEIAHPGRDRIRALISVAGNPVLSAPNGKLLEEALPRLDFMAAVDWYVSETSRHAHIILPPTHMLEHHHFPVMANIFGSRNMAKYSPPVFDPGPDARHAWQIFKELAVGISRNPLMKLAIKPLTPERLLKLALLAGPHGLRPKPGQAPLTLGKVSRAVHGLDLGPLRPCLPGRLFTPDRRINLAPPVFTEELKRVSAALPALSAEDDGEFDLRLVSRRNLMSNNSWMHNIERFHNKTNRCTAWISPGDAAARNVPAGGRVRVTSRAGRIELEAEITDRVMPGVVSIPHGWGHHYEGIRLSVAAGHAGVSVNDITDHEKLDSLSGNAVFSGVPVKVEPV